MGTMTKCKDPPRMAVAVEDWVTNLKGVGVDNKTGRKRHPQLVMRLSKEVCQKGARFFHSVQQTCMHIGDLQQRLGDAGDPGDAPHTHGMHGAHPTTPAAAANGGPGGKNEKRTRHKHPKILFLEVGEGGKYLGSLSRLQTLPKDKPKEINRWMDDIYNELAGQAPTNPETQCSSDAFTPEGSEAEAEVDAINSPRLGSPDQRCLYDQGALAAPTLVHVAPAGADSGQPALPAAAIGTMPVGVVAAGLGVAAPQGFDPSAAVMNLWMDSLRAAKPLATPSPLIVAAAPSPSKPATRSDSFHADICVPVTSTSQLQPGNVVSATQIRLSPSLNGKQGTVVAVDAGSSRATIRFPSPHGTLSLRIADIELVTN